MRVRDSPSVPKLYGKESVSIHEYKQTQSHILQAKLLIISLVYVLGATSLWPAGRLGGCLMGGANAHPPEQVHGRCNGRLELTLQSGDM